MALVEGEIVIERPVTEVFDLVADERNEPRFNPRMIRVELLSPEPIGAGSRFLAESRMMGRAFEVMVEYTVFERPRHLGSRSRSTPKGRGGRPLLIEGSLTFEPVPEGTRMRWSWQVETPGALRLIAPLLEWMGRRQEQEGLDLLEAASGAAAGNDAGGLTRLLDHRLEENTALRAHELTSLSETIEGPAEPGPRTSASAVAVRSSYAATRTRSL